MDDLPDIFARGFRLQPQGKSAPMAASRASASASTTGGFGGDPDLWPAPDGSSAATSSWNKSTFGWNPTSTSDPFLGDRGAAISDDYVFVGDPARSNSSSHGQSASSSSPAAFDSVFDVFADSGTKPSSSLPVYDKPVYDDDVLDGIPGAKGSSSVKYDDVFASVSSGPNHVSTPPYEDLLENLGKQMPDSKGVNDKRSEEQEEQEVSEYDELIPGFGGSSLPKNREDQEASQWKPDASSAKPTTNEAEDPFVVLESVPTSTYSSSGLFSDPSENINRPINSGSMRVDTSVSARIFDDGNAYDGISKSVPWSTTEMDERQKDKSLLDDIHNIFPRHHDSEMVPPQQSSTDAFENIMPQVQPTKSSDLQNPFGRSDLHSTDMYGRNAMRDQSPKSYEHIENRDDVWLTVSEILLHTQPTSAPPPSRSPPPLVIKQAPFGADAKRKENESSRQSAQSHPYNENLMKRSPIDQLEDFAMGKPQTYARHHEDFFTSEEKLEKKLAAEAAMKEAMDRAEAKFKDAKEVREEESDGKDLEDIERQERLDQERVKKEREEKEEKRLEKEREQEVEREREKARQAAERAIREARERAAAEARLKAERAAAEARQRAERAAVQRAAAEARERAAAVARERAEKAALEVREKAAAEAREKAAAEARERAAAAMERAAAEVREKAAAEARERVAVERAAAEARLRAQRAAVERAAAEARERLAAAARERAAAAAAAREEQQKPENDLESFFGMGARANSAPKQRSTSSETMFDVKAQTKGSTDGTWSTSSVSSSTIRKVSSTTNIVDDLTSIFGGSPSSGEFQEIEGESEERRRARIERHQRTQERAAKALAEKNERDMQIQREQAERHRIAETLDIEIKRWAAGKEGNLRALLSTLQYVLWPESGWQPVSLTDLITAAAVKKVYRKATLCIHPDKVQQKGATLQQKYIAEKVFDLLKEAWNKFNSEELF